MRSGPRSRWTGDLTRVGAPLTLVALLALSAAAVEHDGRVPVPPAESAPGANLYWHDPGASWQEGCECTIETDTFGYAPRWYVRTDLEALRRDNLRGADFAAVDAGGPTLLGTSSMEDHFKAGTGVLVGWSLNDWYRIEGSYSGAFHWSDSAAVRNDDPNAEGGTGNLFSPFSHFGDPPLLGLDYNDFVRIRFSSELDNVELNVRRRIGLPPDAFEASFLVGIRYLRVAEHFRYQSEANVPAPLGATNDVLTATNNDMVGVQIGLLTQYLINPRIWIDFEIKGAAFSNSANLHTRFDQTDENGIATRITDHDDKTRSAGLLDLSLTLNHQFTRSLTFRVGYNALFLTGVALGADNFSRNAGLMPLGPVLLNSNGRVIYHGPTIGLVGAW